MKFEMGFNHNTPNEHEILIKLGCTLDESVDDNSYYWKELTTLDEAKELVKQVNELMKDNPDKVLSKHYSLIVNWYEETLPFMFFDNRS